MVLDLKVVDFFGIYTFDFGKFSVCLFQVAMPLMSSHHTVAYNVFRYFEVFGTELAKLASLLFFWT